MRRERTVVTSVVAMLILGLVGSVSAATYNWNVANGDWSTAGNWDTATEPYLGDTAYINNGGTAAITAMNEAADSLVVGSGGATGNVSMTSGYLVVAGIENIGQTGGVGIFTQSGGTHTPKTLSVGATTTATGTYNLQGGTLDTYSSDIEYIGRYDASTGTINHTGGTNTTDQIWMALSAASNGAYNLDAGDLSVTRYFYLGMHGVGSLAQTGGTSTIGTLLNLAFYSDGTGSYAISGGSLNATGIKVGVSGAGTLTVTGANPTIDFGTYIQNATSTLNAQIDAGGISTINVSGAATLDGTLNVTDLGSAPVGTFNILVASGGITGSHATVNLPGGGNWSSGITGNTLWVTNVPEPATMGLMLIGAGLMMVRSRRRK